MPYPAGQIRLIPIELSWASAAQRASEQMLLLYALMIQRVFAVTDWQQFQQLDYADLAARMNSAIAIDGRNCLNPDVMAEARFYCIGVGCPAAGSLSAAMRSIDASVAA